MPDGKNIISTLMGRFATSAEDPSLRVEETILLPETVSRRKLPVNFHQKDLGLFSNELERLIPAARLLEFQDIGVSAEGMLFKRAQILLESFAFPWQFGEWKTRAVLKFLLNNYILRKRRALDYPALVVVDQWSSGYFHWLADALTRLYMVRDRLNDTHLLLPDHYKRLEFVQSSLKPFNVRKVEYIDARETLLCKKLLLPMQTAPSGHYNEGFITGVRDLMVDFYGHSRDRRPKDRVYISRSNALKRNIVNEEEVIDVLKHFGFQILHSEHLSFAQQVKLLSGADYLVSNHGAGLANMLFMYAGGNVLELRHNADRINNCYFPMAAALNLNYFYQNCEPQELGEDPHTAHLMVDTPLLRENLTRMLSA
jgi:hypothetical protein